MNKPNIGVLAFSIGNSGSIPTSNLIDILSTLSGNIYLLTGNDGHKLFCNNSHVNAYGINHKTGGKFYQRIFNYVYSQMKISYKLFILSKNVDYWIFFIGGDSLVLPMLAAKLWRKKVILCLAGSSVQILRSSNDFLSKPLEILSKINFYLSDRIIIYSKNLINEWNLHQYQNKIIIAPRHFLNFSIFNIKSEIVRDKCLIGYIGRFENEKGIMNFVKSIPLLLEKVNCLEFVLIGDGTLKGQIEEFIIENGLRNKVKLEGWVSHDRLPDHLNKFNLIVLPSYTEGLPNLMLEAMACGAIVLANPVGSIPDVIIDGKTGFVMENNSPECIAKNVQRVLECSDLELIVKNSRSVVNQYFCFNAAVLRYKAIFDGL